MSADAAQLSADVQGCSPVESIPGGGDCAPNKNIPGQEYLFTPLKVLAEVQKIAARMHHKSPF